MDHYGGHDVKFRVIPYLLFAVLTGLLMMVNGSLIVSIRHDFYMTASMTGVMTSAFFFFLAIAQIAIVQMVEMHDSKVIQVFLSFIAVFGMVVYATASSIFGLTFGRAIMGLGCSSSYYIAYRSMHKPRSSILFWCIAIGALLATYPAYFMILKFGGQATLLIIGGVTLFLTILMAIIAPSTHGSHKNLSTEKEIRSWKMEFSDPHFQKVAIPIGVGMGTYLAIQSLWITPWLIQGLGHSAERGVLYLFTSALGMLVGLVQGHYFHNYRTFYIRYGLFILLLGLLAFTSISQYAIFWFLFGYLIQIGHFGYLMFKGKKRIALYTLVLLLTFFIQVVMGCVIDIWERNLHEIYPPVAFKAAITFAIFVNVIAWLISVCMEFPNDAKVRDKKRG